MHSPHFLPDAALAVRIEFMLNITPHHSHIFLYQQPPLSQSIQRYSTGLPHLKILLTVVKGFDSRGVH